MITSTNSEKSSDKIQYPFRCSKSIAMEIQTIPFEIRSKPRIIRLAFVLAVQINVIKQAKGEL